jgi:hypothetical protein
MVVLGKGALFMSEVTLQELGARKWPHKPGMSCMKKCVWGLRLGVRGLGPRNGLSSEACPRSGVARFWGLLELGF